MKLQPKILTLLALDAAGNRYHELLFPSFHLISIFAYINHSMTTNRRRIQKIFSTQVC